MEYFLKPSAVKALKKLSKKERKRILDKLDFVFSYEKPLEFAKPLHDTNLGAYRLRIGDLRASFDVEGDIAVILAVGNRKDIYR
ncbi:type II toxin-antitoxin system RelE/ParE family toxin [bacterium]|nr:type II toxin-antitoxin system RelE/ParE family toxin [bacterium]